MFGCVDTWILYKLTGKHVTEVKKYARLKIINLNLSLVFFQKASNIAATGIYDPFTMDYASWVFNMFDIPMSMMPKIVDSCGDHFGATKPGIKDLSFS